ncbi:hypothetical protein N752_02235 [Desulforamulus aquiferis]|nr:PUA domain-containing protein [Desulforamulus aquiferis]RYD06773.1 hypothetical protein N752_02235 [Desulforamulus aquiferis]
MRTKLAAARIAARSGIKTVITSGNNPESLKAIASGEKLGTSFEPANNSLKSRKQWIAFGTIPRGTLRVDEGAARALMAGNKSLLAVGVVAVTGNFPAGSIVAVEDLNGLEMARGITNLSARTYV